MVPYSTPEGRVRSRQRVASRKMLPKMTHASKRSRFTTNPGSPFVKLTENAGLEIPKDVSSEVSIRLS
jgi:hypothetical protein